MQAPDTELTTEAGPPPPLARRHAWRDRMLLLAPTLAFGLLILTLWGLVAWFVIERPQQLLEEQRRELANSVQSAAMQTDAVLRQAESAVRVVDLWLDAHGPAGVDGSVERLADVVRTGSGRVVDVVLIHPSGTVRRLESPPSSDELSVADRALLDQAQALTRGGIVFGLPIRLGSQGSPARWQLPVLLRLARPVQGYHTVAGLINLERLRDIHSLYTVGPTAALTLVRADGVVLSRYPEIAGLVGQDLRALHPNRHDDFNGFEGFFSTAPGETTDGLARSGAYATLPDYGMKLLLSQATDSALADHRRGRSWVLIGAILVSVALGLLARWLGLLQRAARLRDAALQATSNAVTIGLFRTTTDGRIVYVNDAYLRVHGLKREDIAWGWTGLVPQEQREPLIARWKQMMATGEPITMVRKMKRGDDGRIRMLSVRTAPLIMDGKVVGQAGTVEDVTDVGEREQAFKTLTAIFDMTPDYVCQVREDGEISYLNPAARALSGVPADAPLQGLHLTHFYAPERLKIFQEQMLPVALRDGHWRGRSAAVDAQGHEVAVDATVLVHKDVRGRIETISVLMRDVSEQARVQRERQRSEAMLLAVAHTTPALICVIDNAQRVIFLNAAYESQRQVRREDWVGRPVSELLGTECFERRRPLIEQALAGETCRSEMEPDSARDGRTFDVQIAPLRVQSGEIEGVIVTELDVTDARREEARLRLASLTDPLTQLLNRSGFDEGAQRMVRDAAANEGHVAVMYLDLDKFKPVNDAHGHPTGDALLKAVALRLRHTLRPADLVARLGGDEFAVMLDKVQLPNDVAAVADKLVQTLSRPFHIGKLQLEIGVSVGWCLAEARQTTLNDMVAQADAHLYEAKRAGRGRACGAPLTQSDVT